MYIWVHIFQYSPVLFCSRKSLRIKLALVIKNFARACNESVISHNYVLQGIAPLLGFDVDIKKKCVECVTLNLTAVSCVNASTSALLPSVSLGSGTTRLPPCREDIAKVRTLQHVAIGISLFCHYLYIV